MSDEFSAFYDDRAGLAYALCCLMEGEGGGERAERLFADLWKRVYAAQRQEQPCSSLVGLCRHLQQAQRGRRGGSPSNPSSVPGLSSDLLNLAPEFRLPLVLREGALLSYRDLASALEIPVPTVRARLARARALLRKAPTPDSGGGTALDDELISACLDEELQGEEVPAVARLVGSEPAWSERLEGFRADAEALRALPLPGLPDQVREIVYRSVTEKFALGAERRRVPRFRRRWMLLAAFMVPCALTLLYLQNPNRDSRLYLRPDGLVLRAGRTGERQLLTAPQRWTSPPLWGRLEAEGKLEQSLQADAGRTSGQTLVLELSYDFDGDGQADRVERYLPVALDGSPGWERLRPQLGTAEGEWADFRGGTVTLRLGPGGPGVELSGSAGEMVLPYRHLRSEAP